jgi:hypothetical protein
MADDSKYRTLKETEEFTAQLQDFINRYSGDNVEATLSGIYWAIAKNPEVFKGATWNIRQARSRSFGTVPAFKILFQIQDDDTVLLLWIEETGATEELDN